MRVKPLILIALFSAGISPVSGFQLPAPPPLPAPPGLPAPPRLPAPPPLPGVHAETRTRVKVRHHHRHHRRHHHRRHHHHG